MNKGKKTGSRKVRKERKRRERKEDVGGKMTEAQKNNI